MKKINTTESSNIVKGFLTKFKLGLEEKPSKVEYLCLTIKEPIYEKLNCAYLQTNDLKEGILYEAVTNRIFTIKPDSLGVIKMDELSKSVNTIFPKLLKDKMFWVCGNKKDKEVLLTDLVQTSKSI